MCLRIFVFIWCASSLLHIHIWWIRIQYYITTWLWDFIGRSISTLWGFWGFWIKVIVDSRLSARKMSPTSVRQNEGLLSCVYKYGLTLFPTTFEWPRRNSHWGATIVCANFLSLSLLLFQRSAVLSATQAQILCLDKRMVDSSARILVRANCGSESLKHCAKVSPVA